MASFDPATGPDYGRLKSTLANSKQQAENNALYQTILGLIDGIKRFQQLVLDQFAQTVFISDLNDRIDELNIITVVEVDTSGPVTPLNLSDYVLKMTIFKDITGNAGANNITLLGTVEGTVDPVINTNFGFYKVYNGVTDGLFHTW